MENENSIEGQYIFDVDTKRYHRFLVKTENDVVTGSIYISRKREKGERLPKKDNAFLCG
jgi:hypothetical protein